MKPSLFVALLVCSAAFGQEKESSLPVRISGSAFGDYYVVARHHRADIEGRHGFWLRRAYLTFDRDLGQSFSARLRFEMSHPGDFASSTNAEPVVKDAYLRWKGSERLEVVAGISMSPTFALIEQVWGYRSVERTPLDLQRMSPSRDFGVAVLGRSGAIGYHVMYGNGSNTGAETNEGKKLAAAVNFAIARPLVIELYADREERPGDADRSVAQLFAAWQQESHRIGVQYAHQSRSGGRDLDLASIFAVYLLRKDVALIARIDRMFDPNPEGNSIAYLPLDPNAKSTLFIAGADWKVHKNVSIIPNVEVVAYDRADTDLMPRLTLSITF